MTKKNKHLFRLKNFHYLKRELAKRKVASFAPFIQEALTNYNDSLKSYASFIINYRFGKSLTTFFDELDVLLKSHRSEDIQFQTSHSKQVLAKLIANNTITDTEKKLMLIYKKLDYSISDAELLWAVWAELKEQFTARIQHYEEVLKLCYKNQGLLITIPELKRIFSNVEKKI